MREIMKRHNTAEPGRGKRKVITAILVAGIFITSLGASFSMYRTSAPVRFNAVGVAAYAVSAGSDSNNLVIDCNQADTTAAYEFWVKNSKNEQVAEVDVEYDVEVKLKSALPAGISLSMDGVPGAAGADHVYTFTGKTLEAGTPQTETHKLTFTADAAVIESETEIPDIVITVETMQAVS